MTRSLIPLFLLIPIGLTAQDDPLTQAPVELKRVGVLKGAGVVPVAFSPDGKKLVYIKWHYNPTTRKRVHIYVRVDADCKNPTEIFTTPVDSDSVLVGLAGRGMFSKDGKNLAAITTRNGLSYRRKKGPLSVVVLDAQGNLKKIAMTLPQATGFAYAGNTLVVLETHGLRRRQGGYRLVAHTGRQQEVLDKDAQGFAVRVRASADGKKVALLKFDLVNRKLVIRIVDLKTKKAIETPGFRSEDLAFKGEMPLFYWDANSAGVYYHARLHATKHPFALMRFDIKTKTANRFVARDDMAVAAVLDANHLVVHRRKPKRAGILRISDKRVFPIIAQGRVLGGWGNRIVVYDGRTRAYCVATFTLPTRTAPVWPAVQEAAPIKLKQVGELKGLAGLPATFSPDEKKLVYITRHRNPDTYAQVYTYVRADADGKNPTEVFTTPVERRDVLALFVGRGMFSRDGRRLAALTTRNGLSHRKKKDPLNVAVLDAKGNETKIAMTFPQAMGFAYAGNTLVVLETHSLRRRRVGYRLVAHTGKKQEVIEEDTEGLAMSMRASPDGEKVGLLKFDLKKGTHVIRIVDLKTKKAIETPEFKRGDALSGIPRFYWDAKSAGVYYHADFQLGTYPFGLRYFVLVHFDVKTKKAKRVMSRHNVKVTSVLDANHLAVATKRAGILRLSDMKLFPIIEHKVLGGTGNRVVVYAARKKTHYIASFELPKREGR